jgi:hypothetical protein
MTEPSAIHIAELFGASAAEVTAKVEWLNTHLRGENVNEP